MGGTRQGGRHYSKRPSGLPGGSLDHPHRQAHGIARSITDALDPSLAPGKVRTLADMSPEERAEMVARYTATASRGPRKA